jgi:hypothetical protein
MRTHVGKYTFDIFGGHLQINVQYSYIRLYTDKYYIYEYLRVSKLWKFICCSPCITFEENFQLPSCNNLQIVQSCFVQNGA